MSSSKSSNRPDNADMPRPPLLACMRPTASGNIISRQGAGRQEMPTADERPPTNGHHTFVHCQRPSGPKPGGPEWLWLSAVSGQRSSANGRPSWGGMPGPTQKSAYDQRQVG